MEQDEQPTHHRPGTMNTCQCELWKSFTDVSAAKICWALIVQNLQSRGKRDSGSSLQNSSPLPLCLAWKKVLDWSSQSSSCISAGCSLTAAFRGYVKRSMRGCMLWMSWKLILNCSCRLSISFLYLAKKSCTQEHLWASPCRQGSMTNLLHQVKIF